MANTFKFKSLQSKSIAGGAGTFTTLSANNGTLTASAPVLDLAQTWNNSGVTFTGLAATITNTQSAAGSLVARLTVGSTNVFEVDARGFTKIRKVATSTDFVTVFEVLRGTTSVARIRDDGDVSANSFAVTTGGRVIIDANGVGIQSTARFGLSSGVSASTTDCDLYRDAADTFAQRRTTNPQTFRLYTTYGGGGADYERLFIKGQTGGAFQIGTEKGGSGGARDLTFLHDGTTRLTINDRIRTGSTSLVLGSASRVEWGAGTIYLEASTAASPAYFKIVTASTDRLNFDASGIIGFGGLTNLFPALKRSSTTLQVRLADDTAFAPLQASQFNGPSDANLTIAARGTTALTFDGNEMYMSRQLNGQGTNLYNFNTIGFGNASSIGDAIFARDAADTIAQRRGALPQTFRIYGQITGSDTSATGNYERGYMRWSAAGGVFQIGTEKGSGGGLARALEFQTDGVTRGGFYSGDGFYVQNSSFGSTGMQIQVGANRGGMFFYQCSVECSASATTIRGGSNSTDWIRVSSGLLLFQGTTNLFPALKRSSTALQVRLADDSAFAPFEASNITATGDVIANRIQATVKNFHIKHPTKPDKHLVYSSLETPYNGVQLTGEAELVHGKCIVQLPDYLHGLIHANNVHIQLTNHKHSKVLYVDSVDIQHNRFTVKCNSWISKFKTLKFFWLLNGVRKDIELLQTEV